MSMKKHMKKKIMVFILCAMLFALCVAAEAQQAKKIPRIGSSVSRRPSGLRTQLEAFRQGLRDLGYVEGKNITIEYRFAEGNWSGMPGLVAELVRLKVKSSWSREVSRRS